MNTTEPFAVKSSLHAELLGDDSVILWRQLRRESHHNANLNWDERDYLACTYRDAACILWHRHRAQLQPVEWGDVDDELCSWLDSAVGLNDGQSARPGALMRMGEAEFWDGGEARFAALAAQCSPANIRAALSAHSHVGFCQCGAALLAFDSECWSCAREANPPTNTRGEIGEPS